MVMIGRAVAAIELPHTVTAMAKPRPASKREETALVQIVGCVHAAPSEIRNHRKIQFQ